MTVPFNQNTVRYCFCQIAWNGLVARQNGIFELGVITVSGAVLAFNGGDLSEGGAGQNVRHRACPSNDFEKRKSFEGQPQTFLFSWASRDYRLTHAPTEGANTSICFPLDELNERAACQGRGRATAGHERRCEQCRTITKLCR